MSLKLPISNDLGGYCLETVSICKVDVDEEFTNVFKKIQKC